MFSTITSYIWGADSADTEQSEDNNQQEQQPATATDSATASQAAPPCHLKTRAADDEWVLVDTSSLCSFVGRPPEAVSVDNLRLSTSEDHDSSGNSSPLGSPRRPTVVVSLSRSIDTLSDTSAATTASGASTPVHVVYPSMEESWLVTPPPCFTAGGNSPQRVLETGPMENLLIEHPSMSVYGPRGRQSSAGADSNESDSSSEGDMDTEAVPASRSAPSALVRQPPRRPRAVAACAGLLAQVEANRSMQIVKQRQETRKVTRNKLSKSNKVSHHQSQNKHMRRKHYMLRPSGRSNNRRC